MNRHRSLIFLVVSGLAAMFTCRVAAQPLVLAGASNKSAFVGDANVTFQVEATGSPAPTYQWQTGSSGSFSNLTNNTTFANVTTANLTINSPTLALNGTGYRCLVTNSGGTTKSLRGALTVYNTPTVTPVLTVTGTGVDGSGNPTIAANSTANITIQVTGLNAGDTIHIQRFLDYNDDGKTEVYKPLIQSFNVTDGQVTQFGGVTDADIPGDDDSTANGNITTHITLPTSPESGRLAGTYIIKVSSPTGEFEPLTQEITITQPTYGQYVSGQVVSDSGGSPVPYASVVLLSVNGQNEQFVAGTVADANGNYTVQASPGNYTVAGFFLGYVQTFSEAAQVTLASGQNQTSANLSLTPATCTVNSQVENNFGGVLSGVQYFVQSGNNGQVLLAYTNSNGNLTAALTSATDWNFNVSQYNTHALGVLQPQSNPVVDTTTITSGNVNLNVPSSPDFQLTVANALIYGKVKDTEGNALAGVNVSDDDSTYQDNAITNGNGSYDLLAYSSQDSVPDQWTANVDSNNPSLAGYTLPEGQDVQVLSGVAYQINTFAVTPPPTPLGSPVVLAGAVGQTAFVGDASATFSVLATSNTTLSYQWQTQVNGVISNITNNSTFAGATTATLTINNPTLTLNGTGYRCVVTNSVGSVYSLGAKLKVYNPPTVTPVLTVTGTGVDGSGNPTIAANSTANVTIHVTGLNAGDTIDVARFFNANGSGQVEIGDPLVQVFQVIDGQAVQFNGVTDPRIPGDDDGVADGNITTHFKLPYQSAAGEFAGSFIIKVVSPTGEFKPITQILTVTPPGYPQTINGQITSGGVPVPYAAIALLDKNQNDETLLGGVFADANGNYSIQAAPGTYALAIGGFGFLGPKNFTSTTLGSTGNVTGLNVSLTAATCTITTSVEDSSNNSPLPGVELRPKSSSANLFGFAFTNSDGNVIIPVTAASDWNIEADESSLDSFGFLPPANDFSFDTTGGGLIPAAFEFTPANALIYGTLKDSNNNPLAGVDVYDSDNGGLYEDDSYTDAGGNYFLLASDYSEDDSGTAWNVGLDNDSPVLAGYIVPNGINDNVFAGNAYEENFVATHPTAFLEGTVTNNGTPVVGVTVDASPPDGGNSIQATTDSNGNFTLGVSAGTWNVSLDSGTADQDNLVSPQLTEILTANQTITGILLPVLSATATVTGTVDNQNGNPLSSNYNVDATATINNLLYNAQANLNNNGNGTYTLPLVNGNWTFNVYGPNTTNIQNVNVTVTGNQTLNLAPPAATAFLQGTVTNNGTAVAGVLVDANPVNGSGFYQATTDGNGNFSIGVNAGTWNVYLDGSDSNLIGTQLTETLATNETISGLSIQALTPTDTISGQVTDANGNPLSSQYNVSASATVNGQQYNVDANLNSNGNGTYSLGLVDGTWTFNVYGPNGTPPNFQPTSLTFISNETLNLSPVLPTAYFNGTVTNNGTPVVGVVVDANEQNGSDFFQATTDSNGNYSIGVVAGTWNIYVGNTTNLVTSTLSSQSIIDEQTISGLDIDVLTATDMVTGTATDTYGNPLSSNYNVFASATINSVQYNASTNLNSNGNGTYSFGLVNGNWTFSLGGPNGPPTNFQNESVTITGNQVVNLSPPQPTAYLQGTVTGNGAPLAGVVVTASDNNNDQFQATTASDGTFSVGAFAGFWSLSFSDSSQNIILPNSIYYGYTVTDGSNITGISVPVLLPVYQISGTVLDSNNQPITSAFVTANITINGVSYDVGNSVDNNGDYALLVANGTWQVSENAYGYLDAAAQNVVVNSSTAVGGNVTANFTEPVTAHLQGTVTDNYGNPVADVTIYSVDQIGDTVQTTSQVDGTFNLGVIAGNWTLSFYSNSQNLIFPSTVYSYVVTTGADITGIAVPVLEPNEQISGTVLEANDSASAFAEVSANTTINGIAYNVSNITDDNGDYSLGVANGNWTVSVSPQSGIAPASQVVVVDGSSPVEDFTQPAPPTLQGTVTSNGNPLAGVTINAYDDVGDQVSTTSASDGTFSLTVFNGTWTLSFSSDASNLILPSSFGPYTVTNGVSVTGIAVPVLDASEQISGTVLYSNNQPITGAQVVASANINGVSYSVVTATDNNGAYTLGVTNGTWLVSVTTTDGLNLNAQNVVVNDNYAVVNFTQQLTNFAESATAYLIGNVTLNGSPLANVTIDGYDESSDFDYTTSATDGTFSLGVLAGDWTLHFSTEESNIILPDSLGPYVVSTGVDIANISVPALAVTQQISGNVLDLNGQPSVGAEVTANLIVNGISYTVRTSTDENGHYSLGVANGTWIVSVTDSGFNPSPQNVVVSNANQVANFAEYATAYLQGTVTVGGTPVANVTIQGYDDNSNFDNTSSASDGTFSLGVIDGDWMLRFYSNQPNLIFPTSMGIYSFSSSANATGIVVPVLAATEQITGTVQDFNNQPSVGAEVNATTTINGLVYTVLTSTDQNGHYALGVANATWTVSVSDAGFNPGPQNVVVNGANQIANFAESATAYLQGTVTLNGSPLSGITIYGYDNSGDYDNTNSASDGTFSLGVIGGAWTLNFGGGATGLILPNPLGPYDVTDGTNITGISVPVLSASEQISGSVLDLNSQPSVGAELTATTTISGVGYTVRTSANENGQYVLGVANGNWTVSVTGAGFNPPPQNVVVNGSNQVVEFSETPPPAPPNITSQPQDAVVTAGQSANFSLIATGYPAPSYQWQVSTDDGSTWSNLSDNATYSGSAGNVLNIANTSLAQDGYQFQCVLSSTYAGSPVSVTSNAVTLTVNPVAQSLLSVVMSADANLKNPAYLATDGTTLYVSGGAADSSQNIYSVPATGGAATFLHPAYNPQELALIGGNVDWIDPNSGPVTDTQILSASTTAGGSVNAIYTGSDVGQPIVDGSGLATDGASLYAADEVDGTVWRLNPDGSGLTELGGARYSGYFSTEHFNSVAVDQGVVYVADSGDSGVSAPQVIAIAANGNGASSFTTLFTGAPLVQPRGIAAGGGYVYLSDPGANNTIWQIPEGGGTPVALVSGAPFVSIAGLAYANGILYIADQGAGIIYQYAVGAVPSFVSQPENNAVIVGGNATFTAIVNGYPAPSIQWQISIDGGNTWTNITGNEFTGATSPTLTVTNPALLLSGDQFRAVATNTSGSPTISSPVTLQVGISSNYLNWLNSNFDSAQLGNPSVSGATATPAGDGIPNLLKYALGLPPLASDRNSMPQPTAGSGVLSLSFSAALTDVTYTVQASTDLNTWTTTGVNTQVNAGVETATYSLPSHGPAFLRIMVAP